MTPILVVCNSSPIIALAQIEALELLRLLFTEVTVPPAVHGEIQSVSLPDWIQVRALVGKLDPRVSTAALDAGEREVLGLALERHADLVVLDDLPARLLAEKLDIPVIGTIGVLLLAKQRGLLPAIRPSLDALRGVNFFLAERLYLRLLVLAGEA
jgi:uncharacterized protein